MRRQRKRPPRVQVREKPTASVPDCGAALPNSFVLTDATGGVASRVACRKRNVTPDASQAIPSHRPAQCDDSDSDRPVCRCAKTHSHMPGWARSSQQVCAHRRDGGRCVTGWLAGSATLHLMPLKPFLSAPGSMRRQRQRQRQRQRPPRVQVRENPQPHPGMGPLFPTGLCSPTRRRALRHRVARRKRNDTTDASPASHRPAQGDTTPLRCAKPHSWYTECGAALPGRVV